MKATIAWIDEKLEAERMFKLRVEQTIATLEAVRAAALKGELDGPAEERCGPKQSPEVEGSTPQQGSAESCGSEHASDIAAGSGESDEQDALYYP